MSYIGNTPFTAAFLTDTFSGNGSTVAFTLSAAPANTSSIIVAVAGVLQDPSTYSVSGTTLTFSAAPPSATDNISVRFLGIPASGVTTTAYRTVTEFTATSGQTSFSVPSYTVGYVDVYRNGVMLGTADFTATTGTTIVLATGATSGDLIRVESFYVSSVLNAIPAVAGAVNSNYIAGDQTIGFADGTVSAPSITNTGDTNTGIYFPAADNIGFATNGVIRGRWTTDGLCFGSDTAAANALDDYEEGTFDPTVVGSSSAGTVTYVTRVGRYTKIGNRVFYQFTVIWNSGTGTGNLRVTGLPFTNASGSGFNPPQTIAIQNITLTANHYVVGDCPQGQSRIDVYSQPTGGGATADVAYDAAGDIYCAGHYFVA